MGTKIKKNEKNEKESRIIYTKIVAVNRLRFVYFTVSLRRR
jgi:hypothetical protein